MQPQTLRKTFQNRNKLISNSCMKITRHHHRDHAENRKWRSVTDLIHRLQPAKLTSRSFADNSSAAN
jgi:hypothetical protein